MLHQSNPYVACFKHAADVFSRSNESENLKLVLKQDTYNDLRRYNLPTASEIAVIIASNSTNSPTNRDIVLFKRSSTNPDAHEITHIKETNQYYDPLHYVLIFPFGECGWTPGIKQADGKSNVTAMNFYYFHLMQRQNFNILLKCGRLFHQYIVDQYAKIEQERLN